MALSGGTARKAFKNVAWAMGALMLGWSSVPAEAAPSNTTQAQKAIPTADAKTEAAIQKFIAQFPKQFHDVLAEYRTTKTGAEFMAKVAVLDPIVEVGAPDKTTHMSNTVRSGRPVLVLVDIMTKDMGSDTGRVEFQGHLSNELSTMSKVGQASFMFDLVNQGYFLTASEHMLLVEMASDRLMYETYRELFNKGLYSLGTINHAITNGKFLENEQSNKKVFEIGEFTKETILQMLKLIWEDKLSERVTGYIDRISKNVSVNVSVESKRKSDLNNDPNFSPLAAAQFAVNPAVHYNAMAGDPNFMEVMVPVMLQLRPMMVKALADKGIPIEGKSKSLAPNR